MDELDALRPKFFPEDSLSLTPSTADSINTEDAHYSELRAGLEWDAQDLEAESWSVAVDQLYLKSLQKEAVKRQDVIYELIQTELHHVRTLKLLQYVYLHELRESLQMERAKLDRLFPQVDNLLELHQDFLCCLKKSCEQALEPGSTNNYQITQLGDILVSQFSGERGERIKDSYGIFCCHHSDAVSFYKEQLQHNKKFQALIRRVGQLSIVRRLGIPECILLVTQRITKYPVLVERIIQNTEADTVEHGSLVQALALIKETISQVDAQVNDNEKAARLRDITLRLDPKSQGRLKDGTVFRREDMAHGARCLLHEALVTWKTPSGRLKDIHVVLLSDVLLLLQEKDQKLLFAAVDNKPSVISLQELIVREIANNDKAMILICVSSSEMYEIHSSSKEDRDTWMTLIREAVDSEQEVKTAKLHNLQELLGERDAQITQVLCDKLQIFAAIIQAVTGREEEAHARLLLRGDSSDLQQGETLLIGAIIEVENLQSLLLSGVRQFHPPVEESQALGGLLRRGVTFGGFDSSSPGATPVNRDGDMGETRASADDSHPTEGSERANSDPDLSESQELSFFDRVQMLSQKLYSLQAIITQQDSHMELQRASLSERQARPRTNVLLEKEKQRNLEKQREELANFQKLVAQHRLEQQRWEKERERQRVQAEVLESQLQQREDKCRKLEEKLAEERAELERHRETYQQDLVRLKDSSQAVEKEKEHLEQLKKLKKQNTMSSQGKFNFEATPQLSYSQSLRGDSGKRSGDLFLPPSLRDRSSLPVGPSNFLEVPPDVPLRKESISPLLAKAEVPIHLISTTNQVHNPGAVQQQIPTKLAALGKGKEKSGKAKGSHERTHSAASIDMSQVLPIRVTGKEGGSLRAKRTTSPKDIQPSDRFNPPQHVSGMKSSQSFSTHRRASQGPPPEPPPFPKDILKPKEERVIFL
ncbi:rho guanine nucleotide exchange factor 18a [Aplochiton taeniatus]